MENIIIRVGSPSFGKGQTIVKISNKGIIEASNIYHQDISSCSIELTYDDAYKILSIFKDRIRHIPSSKKRKGVPDEVVYDIEINMHGSKSIRYLLWDNDISKDKELKKVFRQLREYILINSQQKILL